MLDLEKINLHLSGSSWLIIVAVFTAVSLSYLIYRRTIPPVSNWLRYSLMTLRAAALMLVILLLFEPILSITYNKTEKPVVAVLIDNSASMRLQDQMVNRPQKVYEVLHSDLFRQSSDEYVKEFYTFSYHLSDPIAASDSLQFTGDGTDIKTALADLKEKMAEKYFGAVVLITDGANNLGENPARFASSYGVPIYPIAIGDPAEQKDVLISNYITNEIVYADTKIPVDVYVKSSGFDGKRVPINLDFQGQTVDAKNVTLSGNSMEQKVRLYFTPKEPGLFKYQIALPNLKGELTNLNNQKTFYVKVLKSKLKVFIVAGSPGADFLFLKRVLDADENFQYQAFVERPNGSFYQGASLPTADDLAGYDCLILLDYPRHNSSNASLSILKNALARGKPALFFFGKNIHVDKLWILHDFLPLASKPVLGPEQNVYVTILPQGLNHPAIRIAEDELENRRLWSELPPVFSNIRSAPLKSSAQTLAAVDLQRSGLLSRQPLPMIVAQTSGRRKSAAFLTYGLWRWDLLMWGAGKDNYAYRTFINNTIRWLITEEDSKLVKITSNKEIYRSGEEVEFTAQVYHKDYRPVDGAEVAVQLKGEKEVQELSLTGLGQGRYQGSFQVLQGGDYEFTGTAHLQGQVLGRDKGKFSVEEFNLEFRNTRMNEDLLKQIAAESGGRFCDPGDFGDIANTLKFPKKILVQKNEWEIWNKVPLLMVCLLLFTVEWFIRKRKGMV